MNLSSQVKRSINNQLNKEIGKNVNSIVVKEFQKIKNIMVQSFESHPVTKEISAGPNSSNTSGTLGGYGNLFTFIGFDDSDSPIQPLRDRLEKITIRKVGYKNGVFSFITNEPTKEELFSITPMPWASGRSWLDGIETGLSGLGYYLYKKGQDLKSSRSGPAIQLKGGKKSESAFGSESTGGAILSQRSRYRRVSYISSILREFNKSIERLRNSTIK